MAIQVGNWIKSIRKKLSSSIRVVKTAFRSVAVQLSLLLLLPAIGGNWNFENRPPLWISYLLMAEAIADRKPLNFYLFFAMHCVCLCLLPITMNK